jgi:hypothetical protein
MMYNTDMKKSLLFLGFATLVVLGVLHFIAQTFYFYWDMRWFDSVVHGLGGLAIGFLFLWIWFSSGIFGKNTPSKKEAFVLSIVAGMIVGCGWEFFEFAHGIASPIGNYALDTFNDLWADFVGAGIAGIVGGRSMFYE